MLALQCVGRQQQLGVLTGERELAGLRHLVAAVARLQLEAEGLGAAQLVVLGQQHMAAQGLVDVVIEPHLGIARVQRLTLVHLRQHGRGGLHEAAQLLEHQRLVAHHAGFADGRAVVVAGVDDGPGLPAPGGATEGHVDGVDGQRVDEAAAVEHALVARPLALGRALVRCRWSPSSRTTRRRSRRRSPACWARPASRPWESSCRRGPSRVRVRVRRACRPRCRRRRG